MNKILALMLPIMMSSATFAGANEGIKPFGKLSWEDSFVKVAQKVNAMSPEVLLLRTTSKSVDIKGVVSKEALSGKLRDVAKAHMPQYFAPNMDRRMESRVRKYKGLNGVEKKHMDESYIRYIIEVSPILIMGVPFKMEIFFTVAPGLAIHKPDDVLEEDTMGYSFPLIFKGVQLFSRSPLLVDRQHDITKILRDKYKTYDKFNRVKWEAIHLVTNLKDDFGAMISIKATPKLYKVSYASQAYVEKLEKKYREHLYSSDSKQEKNADHGL